MEAETTVAAFFEQSVTGFLDTDTDKIIGQLTVSASNAGFFQQLHSQTDAWREQIDLLRSALGDISQSQPVDQWHIFLEYPIPRRGKRIDCVLLVAGLIIVLEFKCGAKEFTNDAVAQVEDYCLDLRDFHRASVGRTIVPFVVATYASAVGRGDSIVRNSIANPWRAGSPDFSKTLKECIVFHANPQSVPIDSQLWNHSDYDPTPTIIEAAQALYAGQNVREISRCHSGSENLSTTTDSVLQAVREARERHERIICFVTGVPGAGKTLAGLNIVHNKGIHPGELGVFLSGNGPLVRVLTEALARDHVLRTGGSVAAARRHVSTFVQNVHRFIDEYYNKPNKVPVDKVVVFDEAQRAWDAPQSNRKFKRPFSEPEIMLDIMSRHSDWAVIVALVGQGQEINRGEAGLDEWGRTLAHRFPDWRILISPSMMDGRCPSLLAGSRRVHVSRTLTQMPSLHLDVPIRSYRATAVAEFVDALLAADRIKAASIAPKMQSFPIAMTRSLDVAKRWLREKQRGTRRIGLIASSGARRLRAHGLDVTSELDVERWFLNAADDVRSSFYLEVPATEFGIQGLELDWTGLCWGGDLCFESNRWVARAFRGTRWQSILVESTQRFVINKYRVLLTRAREGMIIWIPTGDVTDPTRPPSVYNQVADYLSECGIPQI